MTRALSLLRVALISLGSARPTRRTSVPVATGSAVTTRRSRSAFEVSGSCLSAASSGKVLP
jgi:hypothetical protein